MLIQIIRQGFKKDWQIESRLNSTSSGSV